MSKWFNFLFIVVLLFFYVFDFSLPVVQRSSFLTLLAMITIFPASSSYQKSFFQLIGSPYLKKAFWGYILIIFVCLIIPLVHFTYDFSFIKTLIANLIALVTAIFLVAYIYRDRKDHTHLVFLLVIVFIIQSFIELAALSNSGIQALVSSFNAGSELQQERGIGFRSLALSNATVATLGGVFGVMYLLFFYRLMQKGKVTSIDFIALAILIVGNFFGGRTGYIGLILGLGGFIVHTMSFKILFKLVGYSVLVFFLMSLLYNSSFVPVNVKHILDDKILPWVFEGYYAYQATGSLETGSSNDLLQNHYFSIPLQSFLAGDGRFYVTTGSNETYMHTDAGFMRIILYGGVFLQILMIYWTYKLLLPLKRSTYEAYKVLFYLLFLYAFLFHIKTVSFAYATFNNRLMFLIVFQCIFLSLSERKNLMANK